MVKVHTFQYIILFDMQEMSLFEPWFITATSVLNLTKKIKNKDDFVAQKKSVASGLHYSVITL